MNISTIKSVGARLIPMLILLTIFVSAAVAEQPRPQPAYLVVATLTNTGATYFTFNYHKVNNIELCLELVGSARLEGVPQGGDAEAAVVIYCAPTKAKIWDYEEMSDD
jgi:hypothetical protein